MTTLCSLGLWFSKTLRDGMMKVSLEREGKNIVKLGVEIESAKAMKAYEVACRQVSGRLNIPGFRKGKAPRNLVERAVGVSYLKEEAIKKILPEVFDRVITDEKLDIITQPEVQSYEFELGSPLKIKASVEVRPEVTLGDYRGLEVKVPEAKLPEDAMDKALKSIAEARSTLKTIDPRPVEEGDTLLMDFECYVDGKLVDGGKAEGLMLEIRPGNFLEGFCEKLVGKRPGEKVEIEATFPTDYRNEELKGKNANFKVDIKEIRTRALPPVDDELAKSIGQESLESLKDALKARLEQEVKLENEARTQKTVVDAVVANAQVEIPETMLDRESNLLLQHLKRSVEENGGDWQEFINRPEYPQIYKENKEEARQRVLTSLVLGAVVRAESMMVSAEESTPFLADLLNRYNVPVEKLDRDEKVRQAVDHLRRQAMEEALTRKVVDFLVAQSKIEMTPEEKSEEAAPDKAEAEKSEKKTSRKKASAKTDEEKVEEGQPA